MKKSSIYLEELRNNEHLRFFVSRLIFLRKKKEWSQVMLSKEAGFSLNKVNEIENFTVMPTLDTICKLAQALDSDVGELFPKK
ncbi:MAG: helix-turn-helix transcriptional regulator [Cyanobacteriota bacterium]